MITAQCPECQIEVDVGENPVIGQRVCCPVCAIELEVTWLYPISLDYPEDDAWVVPPRNFKPTAV